MELCLLDCVDLISCSTSVVKLLQSLGGAGREETPSELAISLAAAELESPRLRGSEANTLLTLLSCFSQSLDDGRVNDELKFKLIYGELLSID